MCLDLFYAVFIVCHIKLSHIDIQTERKPIDVQRCANFNQFETFVNHDNETRNVPLSKFMC